ncbi:hypothetical protein GCM10027424_05670 [Psychrobacter pacificensis]|uniref:Uncharacterized protein n=1 Tax=Psychrobacter pacificensis TaxID=112002 RepID=A0ABQ5Z5J0_9GAMM|nr:hypothetical protein AOT82_1364 [Psychrobacter sp. AntiMn-1]BBI66428.1 hypothetical protein PKHYL_06190 [Psychrobacter sp. KH172YL61]GLR30214.1 hypothetical protein GCM10007915_24530 [Psychrobacter pacificensis]
MRAYATAVKFWFICHYKPIHKTLVSNDDQTIKNSDSITAYRPKNILENK